MDRNGEALRRGGGVSAVNRRTLTPFQTRVV